ncbi:uncharacterized protein BXZ73DRAFT_80819 [Epithele typhae]|uniref:uncharacterized protein n=1 Tax=Epithele typhae TaxID=378194 RepID=UPI002008DA1F|nr:uncharacterized protein BXZ73DRAFT_80819 [Epithele typhae]KAH9917363.1 hypothetical protein BXZ73DRAFT_80819 [Epithele typhae]
MEVRETEEGSGEAQRRACGRKRECGRAGVQAQADSVEAGNADAGNAGEAQAGKAHELLTKRQVGVGNGEGGVEDSPKQGHGTSSWPPDSNLHAEDVWMDVLVRLDVVRAASRVKGGIEVEVEVSLRKEARGVYTGAHHGSTGASVAADRLWQQVLLAIHCCSTGVHREVAQSRELTAAGQLQKTIQIAAAEICIDTRDKLALALHRLQYGSVKVWESVVIPIFANEYAVGESPYVSIARNAISVTRGNDDMPKKTGVAMFLAVGVWMMIGVGDDYGQDGERRMSEMMRHHARTYSRGYYECRSSALPLEPGTPGISKFLLVRYV